MVLTIPVMAQHGKEDTEEQSSTMSPTVGALEALQQLGGSLLSGNDANEFLEPDVAFVLSTGVPNANTVITQWTIADAYYLYRDRFKFKLLDAEGVTLGAVELPRGTVKEDAYFGRMEVFYNQIQAILPLERTAGSPATVNLEIGYQGCADAGLCYPPMTKTVALSLPSAVESGGNNTANSLLLSQTVTDIPAAGDLPEQDRLARSLATGRVWLVLLSFFGLGLLLTFTPCVLPMIPILSSIIVGQGDGVTTRKAFTLSLTYVLAMAATYTVAGVIAGLSGANLQAAFQNPWVLGGFSALFVLLAAAMFGIYELQIPPAWQTKLTALSNRQQGGTYIGVGIMGFLSALIVGPCVAAPLAGALIYIAQTGDAVLGGMALFALSLGMGTPVLALGTSAGKFLPKLGPWMNVVKTVFGVLLLGVAIYLLERIVPGWAALLLWAALFIVIAIQMGALDALPTDASGWRRLWKGTSLVTLVYGVLLMVGATTGGNDIFRPLKGLTAATGEMAERLEFRPVKGLTGLESELSRAAAKGQPVMLDFYADWCVSCKELERYTFSDPGVRAVLADAVLLQTDVTANDVEDQNLLKELGLFGPPAILFFGADGQERSEYRVVGFMGPDPFRNHALKALGEVRKVRATAQDREGLS